MRHLVLVAMLVAVSALSLKVHAARFTPTVLCAITSDNSYESITLPIGIGGEYASGSAQAITTIVGDTQSPGGNQASTGDVENVVIFLDTNNDGTPEVMGSSTCSYNQGATPPGCTTTTNISIPAVTEDTSFGGRLMLSYNDTNPANGCGANGFGDSQDFVLVADVIETITLSSVAAAEDDGPITVTATLSHNVRDGSGFVPFTVEYVVSDGTATLLDNDYTSTTGTLTFNGQAGDTETFTITPTADIVPEGDETVLVSLQNLSNSTHGIDISDTATVTFLEDDTEIDLVINKTVDDDAPNVGSAVVFTVAVTNLGPDAAVNAAVQDIVPAGFGSVTPISVPGGTAMSLTGNTIDWTNLNIATGGMLSLVYSATVLTP